MLKYPLLDAGAIDENDFHPIVAYRERAGFNESSDLVGRDKPCFDGDFPVGTYHLRHYFGAVLQFVGSVLAERQSFRPKADPDREIISPDDMENVVSFVVCAMIVHIH